MSASRLFFLINIDFFSCQMRIPTDEFRNVPVALLSPSLLNSPQSSSTSSPSEHQQHGGPTSMMDDGFPRSLMERLLRTDSAPKARATTTRTPPNGLASHRNSSNNGRAALTMTRSMDGPKSLPPQTRYTATIDRR